MNIHDPYTGTQVRFERTDRSGRYYPLVDETISDPWWFAVSGGAAIVSLIALVVIVVVS